MEIESQNMQQETSDKKYTSYWWLSAKYEKFKMSSLHIGETESYSLFDRNGDIRSCVKYANVGDKVIGYSCGGDFKKGEDDKVVVSLFEVLKKTDSISSYIWFVKTANLSHPISWNEIKENSELKRLVDYNNRSTLFNLSESEYNCLMGMIKDQNKDMEILEIDYNNLQKYQPTECDENTISDVQIVNYDRDDFFNEVFMEEFSYNQLRRRLLKKKNIILQGAPGVGKTFSAKRLAYSIMGCEDESRIEMVQFHQNYTYEDFVMGYKPVNNSFDLIRGVFYKFCIKAGNEPDKKHFFIIDEINRGNLSKIFGELLMLIENDYRGKKIRLAYSKKDSKEFFSVPENLYIIGMMNTADRSLAMIDYALRRRFSFFTMKPAFESEKFIEMMEEKNNEKFNKLVDCIMSLNKAIVEDASLGEGFMIGHSYFCNLGNDIDNELADIVEFDILPTLKEYWFDNDGKYNEWSKKLNELITN